MTAILVEERPAKERREEEKKRNEGVVLKASDILELLGHCTYCVP